MKHASRLAAIVLGMAMVSAYPMTSRSAGGACENEEDPDFTDWEADLSFWEEDIPDSFKDAIIGGVVDIQVLAKEVARLGTDFENYMSPRMGNFAVPSKHDKVWSPWRSLLYKLNAVTCPVLMAPYFVPETPENKERRDAWMNALHDLFPKDFPNVTMKGKCVEGSDDDKNFVPKYVAFPDDYTGTDLNAILELANSPVSLKSALWSVQSDREFGAPKSFLLENNLNTCIPSSFLYEETMTQTFTSFSSCQVADSVTKSNEWSLGASAEFEMGAFSSEVSSSFTMGIEETSSQAFGSEESSSHESSQAYEYSATVQVPDNALVNISLSVDEVNVDIFYTGEAVWNENYAGLQFHVQGWGKQYTPLRKNQNGDYSDSVRDLVWYGHYTTPAKILNVVKLAKDVIGAEWSDTFVNSLIHTSANGVAEGNAGSLFMEIWGCDITNMTEEDRHSNVCDREMSMKYPLMRGCSSQSARGSAANDNFDLTSLIIADVCTQYEPADEAGHMYTIKRTC
eukprot:Clim_evm2s4 gene=Clim_evmTU2s4